jgi:uncharacterized glyoxalase superfamily protein PhnB
MANNQLWDAPDIVPSIMYTDLPRAIEWLERVFGFRERSAARLTWPGGAMTWIEIGNSLLNITTQKEARNLPRHPALKALGHSLSVRFADEERILLRQSSV